MALVTVTDATFDAEVVKASEPVLAYFWAEWAGPCKLMTPILEELSDTYAGKLTVAAHNIDRDPATLPSYNEPAVPTMLLFKNGSIAGKRIGAHSKGQMQEFLDSYL
ncbi:thioredoxin [Streptomyces anulatus]|uniref:thioredoxin family protein n=1 Tax=Streptomyces anulatus TaxID=1892 RepID=UPI001C601D90|nr:thioredoxin domain-containing protein [Streptomyces anulatus]QYA98327.1 thioredoxin [Streptomyces anulatus]